MNPKYSVVIPVYNRPDEVETRLAKGKFRSKVINK